MELLEALQLDLPAWVALTGAGGKTTAIFLLARQLPPPVIVTTTTHFALEQLSLADRAEAVLDPARIPGLLAGATSVTCLYGSLASPEADTHTQRTAQIFRGAARSDRNRVGGPPPEVMEEIWIQAKSRRISLLVEADGARRLPLKAPANHEPVVPSWIHSVIVVAGLSGLGKPVTADWVHRLERFAALSGSAAGELVTVEALARLLKHPEGGLKGIPAGARRIALLNQADTEELKAAGQRLAGLLLPDFERVLIASLGLAVDEAGRSKPGPDFEQVSAVHKPVAGVLLAGGGSQRLGRPKQLLPWRGEPLVRHSARAALEAGLEPLVVVTGASREAVEAALIGLPVILAYNEDWNQGQSTSVRAGVQALPATTGAVVFLLSDQPQVPPALIRALIAAHRETLSKIIAPEVAGRRANPVLFDRSTFADLLLLSGDTGGRGIFSRYSPMHIPWYDDSLLLDVDTEEDYLKLLALQ